MNSLLRLALVSLVLSALPATRLHAQANQFDEVVGKQVLGPDGRRLGIVTDTLVDIQNGRYVGMIVSSGGFLGIGAQHNIVPPSALKDNGIPKTLRLDMTREAFRAAPTLDLSHRTGPPDPAQLGAIYRYFGVTPYFAPSQEKAVPGVQGQEPVGVVRRGSDILLLPVENLQGVQLGHVAALRNLNRITGRLEAVVIRPKGVTSSQLKIVRPQDLRYNATKTALRLNTEEQSFRDSPVFVIQGTTIKREDNPDRPGTPPPPLVQGQDERDRAITRQIRAGILADGTFSHFGKNMEIATLSGRTTLRGRVVSEAGKARAIAIAEGVAGRGNVTALLTVQPLTQAEATLDRH